MPVEGRRDRRVGSREDIAMEERRNDLIRELEDRYRPMFEKHGRQGIPLRDLREELEEEGLTESIAPERLDELLRRADADGDKRIRLGEFVRMMSGDNVKEHERKKDRRSAWGSYSQHCSTKYEGGFYGKLQLQTPTHFHDLHQHCRDSYFHCVC